jgi:hypothetical protein
MALMSKQAVSEFVREAVREKASKELVVLHQRVVALDGVERAKEAIGVVAGELVVTASAIAALAPDSALVTKLRKLRKAVEEAQTLSCEIAETLSIDEQRKTTEAARASILRALDDAGIHPDAVLAPAAQ